MDLQRPFFLCLAGLWTWRGHEVRLGDLWHKKKEPWRVLTHCGVEGDILRPNSFSVDSRKILRGFVGRSWNLEEVAGCLG
uniref:Uncharacterized protein n=1 Tax=Picea sitchensis TaxID=3332 RepID=A9NQZ7_PICSI|nr:unknown [Picea sitchensis]